MSVFGLSTRTARRVKQLVSEAEGDARGPADGTATRQQARVRVTGAAVSGWYPGVVATFRGANNLVVDYCACEMQAMQSDRTLTSGHTYDAERTADKIDGTPRYIAGTEPVANLTTAGVVSTTGQAWSGVKQALGWWVNFDLTPGATVHEPYKVVGWDAAQTSDWAIHQVYTSTPYGATAAVGQIPWRYDGGVRVENANVYELYVKGMDTPGASGNRIPGGSLMLVSGGNSTSWNGGGSFFIFAGTYVNADLDEPGVAAYKTGFGVIRNDDTRVWMGQDASFTLGNAPNQTEYVFKGGILVAVNPL